MTEQEAYLEGFCKAAEAYGIDPDELLKDAQWNAAARLGGKMLRGFMRARGLAGKAAKGIKASPGRLWSGVKAVPGKASAGWQGYMGALKGDTARNLRNEFDTTLNQLHEHAQALPNTDWGAARMRRKLLIDNLTDESRSLFGAYNRAAFSRDVARGLTGGTGLLGLTALLGGKPDQET